MFPEHGTIAGVREVSSGYQIDSDVGCFILSEPCDTEIAAGMSLTIYCQNGHGRIQGVDIDSKPIFFKTESELEEERLRALQEIEIRKAQEKKEFYIELANPNSDFNARLCKLPKVFRQRIAKFFRLGEDFWSVATYELYTCMAAVKIANACRGHRRINEFRRSSSDAEKLEVLGQEVLNYLSGHQLAFACALACSYLRSAKSVRMRPGSMQLLTGRKTYFG